MNEREPGIGSFFLGIAVGVTLGLLFATKDGAAFRDTLARRVRSLRALAAEKAGDLGTLVIDATVSGGDALQLTSGRRGRRLRTPGEEDKSRG